MWDNNDYDCGYVQNGNIPWTGKENVLPNIPSWEACCDICKGQAMQDPPCIGWVYNSDKHCYQKYNIGQDYGVMNYNTGTHSAGFITHRNFSTLPLWCNCLS